jgi:SSS family solute:Na+ symporter
MAQNFWTAIFAWTACFLLTILVSLCTCRRQSDEQLHGLVYSMTPRLQSVGLPWHQRIGPLAGFIIVLALVLNYLFW